MDHGQKGGKVRIYGKFCITGGLLVGNRFSRTKGGKLEVEHYGALWKADLLDPLFKANPIYSVGNSNESTTTNLHKGTRSEFPERVF
ncbi:hypothetical protein NDK43_09005 [Neobacillus pocheonensis]|uniref:Uncharacterized protein n=1 Tax=Neobacillus pocheonensis TaxID=363869 RepID=A0ABT0W836_9BACI|nr:hypothetical protein [Neobacillus pocheonensis]